MSDAPAHRLFALLGPVRPEHDDALPDVLCVIQVCLEGDINRDVVQRSLSKGYRSSGDLLPWTVSQQFQDPDFPSLSGARVVRIAVHPDVMGMGYGSHALKLLVDYFSGRIVSVDAAPSDDLEDGRPTDEAVGPEGRPDGVALVSGSGSGSTESRLHAEVLQPRKRLPPLLVALSDRPPERLHWVGVSYGITQPLFNFWQRAGFVPVYLRQTTNELTAEHTCAMLRPLPCDDMPEAPREGWLAAFSHDFARRLLPLLGIAFRDMPSKLALSAVQSALEAPAPQPDPETAPLGTPRTPLGATELQAFFTPHDVDRLDSYARNMVDYHMVVDMLPTIARMVFLGRFPDVNFSKLQRCTLLGLGLQFHGVDELARELDAPPTQLLALFNKAVRKVVATLKRIQETAAEAEIRRPGVKLHANVGQASAKKPRSKKADTSDAPASAVPKSDDGQAIALEDVPEELQQFAVAGSEEEWAKALQRAEKKGRVASVVSVPSRDKKAEAVTPAAESRKKRKKAAGDAGAATPSKKRQRTK